MPNWLASLLRAAAGAFLAAWAGAQLGFRRVKKERALERRIGWYEETIWALAEYEEQLGTRGRRTVIAPFISATWRGFPYPLR